MAKRARKTDDGGTSAATKADAELLKRAKERYGELEEYWGDNRKKWLEDQKFRSGDHWPDDVKKEREDAGRPTLVVDKTEQYVRQVVNDGRQNRPAPKVTPAEGGHPKVAEAFKGLIRSICNKSNADQAFDTSLDHAAGNGYGFFRLVTDFEGDRTFNQEIFVRRIRNPLAVLLGQFQEADGSDAPDGFVIESVSKADFKKRWPNAKAADWKDDGYTKGWSDDKTVRVAEWLYKEPEATVLYQLEDGTVATKEEYERDLRPVRPPEGVEIAEEAMEPVEGEEVEEVEEPDYKPAVINQRTVMADKVKWCKFSGAEVLEKGEWLGAFIPLLIVLGVERDIEGKVSYEGLIRSAKDPQRLYDYARSGFAEHVSLSTRQPMVAADGQLEGHADEWERANTENVAVLLYNPISIDGTTPLPPPRRMEPIQTPMLLVRDMETSEHDLQGSMGMYNSSLGEKSNEKSGKAIMARQREGDTSTFHYHDNLNRAIRYMVRQFVDLIPKVMDTKRAGRILGEDGKASIAQFDPMLDKPFEQRGSTMIYNLGAGKYESDIETGPSYTTKRQEAAEAGMQLAQSVPEIFKIAGDVILRNMDFAGAEEIADRMKKMLPPELQEPENGQDSPETAAVKAQAKQIIDQLTQQIEAAEAGLVERDEVLADMQRQLETVQMQLKNKAGETAVKANDSETKAYEA